MTSWYATSRLGPDDLNSPMWMDDPEATMIHAKRVGTDLTACGRNALTWYKHWVPFPVTGTRNACRDCILAVTAASSVERAARPGTHVVAEAEGDHETG